MESIKATIQNVKIIPWLATGALRLGILKGRGRSLPLSRRPREFTSRRRSIIKIFRGLPRGFLIGILKLYRFLISPFFGQRCRFYPSCSHYAEDALRMHGIFRGCLLAVWRLLRCHPLSAG